MPGTKITNITSEVFEWERAGFWNGSHFYGPGRLHKITVQTDQACAVIQQWKYLCGLLSMIF